AVSGTALGVVVALGAVRAMLAAAPLQVPRLAEPTIGLDARVLLFACAIAAITAVAFGVVPAAFMARGDVERPLRESGRSAGGGTARRTARSVLVVAEVGLAVTLLVGAALLARGFEHLVSQDPGFRPARVVTAS